MDKKKTVFLPVWQPRVRLRKPWLSDNPHTPGARWRLPQAVLANASIPDSVKRVIGLELSPSADSVLVSNTFGPERFQMQPSGAFMSCTPVASSETFFETLGVTTTSPHRGFIYIVKIVPWEHQAVLSLSFGWSNLSACLLILKLIDKFWQRGTTHTPQHVFGTYSGSFSYFVVYWYTQNMRCYVGFSCAASVRRLFCRLMYE